jgi:predicted tellurium resistance membrane protein TerC
VIIMIDILLVETTRWSLRWRMPHRRPNMDPRYGTIGAIVLRVILIVLALVIAGDSSLQDRGFFAALIGVKPFGPTTRHPSQHQLQRRSCTP